MVRLEKLANRVGILYIDNPPLNVLTLKMTQEIISLMSELEYDNDVRVLIITGEGEKAFCAGADINEFMEVRDQVVEKKLKEENKAMLSIERFSKPVIAALNGYALGGGCEISLACDIRIAAENAEIGLPEIKLGAFPGSGGIYRTPRMIGMSKALELMYSGDPITAEEAYRIGLVNYITKRGKSLELAKELAGKWAKRPKHSLTVIKRAVRSSLEISQEEAIQETLELSEKIFKTEDLQEGVRAFLEKREPKFQ
ncbi:enoyl-CoA hydratase [Bacillus sp. FJAT-50079]|uniref:enoyl-CoA hydratase/isomerase family protein n=1 Tax=Bacillus sp. FJAT-50079 TaxID=2833577 RepID=UPI001BC9B410|nr:enoyl-CoA hydratase [Bacillus sp. FJAT-50079]MBS4207533.1 enoyl-CoA hydratase [Bacillus sp. FJAT-50079]